MKTIDFDATKASLVDTTTLQNINAVKRFLQPINVRCGSASINIFPQDFQIGEASIQYFRYADAATPQMGDTWIAGHDVSSGYGLTPQRSFSFWCGGGVHMNSLFPALYITPEGNLGLPQPLSTFSAPSINTSTIRINGTNINVLYQSKSDMTTYITSGSLTNYVNTSTNQTILGKKTFSGGINTKSQTVAGATVLGNDILGGVVRVS